MMDTPWTPGPWTRDEMRDLKGADGSYVSLSDFGGALSGGRPDATSKANGRLCRAAPEMAELLEKTVVWFGDGSHWLADEIRALLTRVKGRG